MVQPKMTESILVFDGQRVSRHLNVSDFEAFLQGSLQLPFSGQHLKLAYVLLAIDQGRVSKSVVLFHVEVAGNGRVPGGRKMPLLELAHRAAAGPELTNGEQIRFACYSQCPMHEFQDLLWDLPTGTRQIYLNEISAAITQIEQTVEWRLILQDAAASHQGGHSPVSPANLTSNATPPQPPSFSHPASSHHSTSHPATTGEAELSSTGSLYSSNDAFSSPPSTDLHTSDATSSSTMSAQTQGFSQEPLYVRQLIDAQETRLRVLREQNEKLLEDTNAKCQSLMEMNMRLKQELGSKEVQSQELQTQLQQVKEQLIKDQQQEDRRQIEQSHGAQQELENYKQQVLKQKRLIKQQQELMSKMKVEQASQVDRLHDLRVDYDALQEEYQQISEAYQQLLLKPSNAQNQFENVIDIKAIKQLKDKLSSREAELNREVGHRLATEQQLQDTIATLNRQISQLSSQSVDALIEDMQEQHIVCVSHLDDGGHIVIMPENITEFLENPDAFKNNTHEPSSDDVADQTDSASNS